MHNRVLHEVKNHLYQRKAGAVCPSKNYWYLGKDLNGFPGWEGSRRIRRVSGSFCKPNQDLDKL